MAKVAIKVTWRRRTNSGRVIYDRPIHKFTPQDVRRIMERVLDQELTDPPPEGVLEGLKRILNKATDAMLSTLAKAFFLPDVFEPSEVRATVIGLIDRLLASVGLDPYVIERAVGDPRASAGPPAIESDEKESEDKDGSPKNEQGPVQQ